MSTLGVVTGGARGIGLACVETLVRDGVVDEVVVLDRDPVQIDGITVVECDVTDEGRVKTVAAELGDATVLVNNAGGGKVFPDAEDNPMDPFAGATRWREIVDLNLTAAHIVTAAFGPRMGRESAICNVASIAGVFANQLFAYSAAKAGIIHWTKTMALALAPRAIRVNAVAPGFIYTDLWAKLLPREMYDAMIGGAVPLGRDQSPEDIANAVAFLCSDRASQITGQTLVVDGGATLGRPPGT